MNPQEGPSAGAHPLNVSSCLDSGMATGVPTLSYSATRRLKAAGAMRNKAWWWMEIFRDKARWPCLPKSEAASEDHGDWMERGSQSGQDLRAKLQSTTGVHRVYVWLTLC